MNEEIPRPWVILQPIGKALQHSQKPGPLQQEHDGGPDNHDIEANPQQIEESFEPKRSPFERLRIESECQSGDLEPKQCKQTRPADIDQTGPRSNGSIIGGDTMQSTSSPRGDANPHPI